MGSSCPNIKQETPIQKIFFFCQHADWDLLHNFHYGTSWTDIFKLPIENCATEVSSWVKTGMDVFIPSQE